jgi:hypothetical protein
MNQILGPIVIGAIAASGHLATVLDSDTKIGLGEAVPIVLFVVALVLYLDRRLQRIATRLENVERAINSRPCQLPGLPTVCPVGEAERSTYDRTTYRGHVVHALPSSAGEPAAES